MSRAGASQGGGAGERSGRRRPSPVLSARPRGGHRDDVDVLGLARGLHRRAASRSFSPTSPCLRLRRPQAQKTTVTRKKKPTMLSAHGLEYARETPHIIPMS